ncbi:MAG TPA: methyltransferase domain-containing protein, partial [Chitinophagaceae bacterium]|nr:methyltransferase domain-containing protein [Chitinophagaceae bacterium]
MATPQNINNIFFAGSYKEVWRKLIPPGLTEAEVDFIIEIGNLKPKSHVLDLMCGYGRHALELGKRQYRVTAIDNLQAYTKEIESKAVEDGLEITAIAADVVTDKLEGYYETAICMGNSLAFFNKEDTLRLLQNVADVLGKNGKLIINTWMLGEIAIRHFKEKDWFYADDYTYLIDNKYLFNPTRIESDHIIMKAGTDTEVIKGIDYIFTASEMKDMLNDAGFNFTEMFSTPRKRK